MQVRHISLVSIQDIYRSHFATTLPFAVEVIIGRKDSPIQRPGEIFCALAATAWLLQPVVL